MAIKTTKLELSRLWTRIQDKNNSVANAQFFIRTLLYTLLTGKMKYVVELHTVICFFWWSLFTITVA